MSHCLHVAYFYSLTLMSLKTHLYSRISIMAPQLPTYHSNMPMLIFQHHWNSKIPTGCRKFPSELLTILISTHLKPCPMLSSSSPNFLYLLHDAIILIDCNPKVKSHLLLQYTSSLMFKQSVLLPMYSLVMCQAV